MTWDDVRERLDSAGLAPVEEIYVDNYGNTLPTEYSGFQNRAFRCARGIMKCLDTKTGNEIWGKDFVTDYGLIPPGWGTASAPLIDGGRVICLAGAGAKGATVVAFDKLNGKELWRAIESPSEPGYCQPIIVSAGGVRQLIIWHPTAVYALNPETGATTTLSSGPATDARPIFSPDGTRIAFRRSNTSLGSPAEDVVIAAGVNGAGTQTGDRRPDALSVQHDHGRARRVGEIEHLIEVRLIAGQKHSVFERLDHVARWGVNTSAASARPCVTRLLTSSASAICSARSASNAARSVCGARRSWTARARAACIFSRTGSRSLTSPLAMTVSFCFCSGVASTAHARWPTMCAACSCACAASIGPCL